MSFQGTRASQSGIGPPGLGTTRCTSGTGIGVCSGLEWMYSTKSVAELLLDCQASR